VKYFIFFFVTAFLLMSSPVKADKDGSEILSACKALISAPNVGDLFDAGKCAGFMAGANSTFTLLESMGGASFYCVPDGVKTEQAIRVLIAYMEKNPARLHLPAIILYLNAMEAAFPCK
jgi:hypothetical protein